MVIYVVTAPGKKCAVRQRTCFRYPSDVRWSGSRRPQTSLPGYASLTLQRRPYLVSIMSLLYTGAKDLRNRKAAGHLFPIQTILARESHFRNTVNNSLNFLPRSIGVVFLSLERPPRVHILRDAAFSLAFCAFWRPIYQQQLVPNICRNKLKS